MAASLCSPPRDRGIGNLKWRLLRSNLLVGKLRDSRSFRGVLDSQREDVPEFVHVEEGVLVEVPRLDYVPGTELDVKRVGLDKVLSI